MGLLEHQIKLLERDIVDLRGDITRAMAEYVRDCISWLAIRDNPDVEVWISSDGGDIMPGFYIYDMIRTYPGYVTGIVKGEANSMASIVLQACDLRQAFLHSVLLLHPISFRAGLEDLKNIQTREVRIRIHSSQERRINQILSENSGQTMRTVTTQSKKDQPMSARVAKEFGLLDELL